MLTIPKHLAEEIVGHVLEEDPNECCGILAGRDRSVTHVYRITNTAKSPYRYLMNPQEQLGADQDAERNKWEFLAFYHSHPHGKAYPSATDVRMAIQSGWLNVCYVVVSLKDRDKPDIRAFHIRDSGEVVEEEIQRI